MNNTLVPLIRNDIIHEQIRALIEKDLNSGLYSEGTKLPGERELAKRYGVSHNTVNKAIKQLEAKGLVEIRRGLGVFAREKQASFTINRMHSFRDWCRKNGKKAETNVLFWKPADENDLELFKKPFFNSFLIDLSKLCKENKLYFLQRLRKVDGLSVIAEFRLVYPCLCSSDARPGSSWMEYVAKAGITPIRGERNMKLLNAPEAVRKILAVADHERLICVCGSGYGIKNEDENEFNNSRNTLSVKREILCDLEIIYYHPDYFDFSYHLSI